MKDADISLDKSMSTTPIDTVSLWVLVCGSEVMRINPRAERGVLEEIRGKP
jgi:hypothetical protein